MGKTSCVRSGSEQDRVAGFSPAPPGDRLDPAAQALAPIVRGCFGAFSDAPRAHARGAADKLRLSSSFREDLPSRWTLPSPLRCLDFDLLSPLSLHDLEALRRKIQSLPKRPTANKHKSLYSPLLLARTGSLP